MLFDMLQENAKSFPELAAEDLFAGMLQSRLGRMIVKRGGSNIRRSSKSSPTRSYSPVKTGSGSR